MESKLYHLGFRGKISRSTLADANEAHDWRIYADFAQVLIRIARPMYASESLGFDLDNTVYALDSTTIDLCLSVFPWARFRSKKAAIKMHTLLDLRGPIPTLIEVSEGKRHDVNILDTLLPEPGAFYVMDRAYVDFKRLHVFHGSAAFFVTRTKKGIQFRRRSSHPIHPSTGLRSDHTVVLAAASSRKHYPDPLRRIHYHDAEQDRHLGFLTNNFDLPALTICLLTSAAGRWNCFSNGSSNTYGSRQFTDTARMPSKLRSGLRCRSRCSWPSSRSGWPWRPVSTKSYRSSASRCSSKCPFYRPSAMLSPKKNQAEFLTS